MRPQPPARGTTNSGTGESCEFGQIVSVALDGGMTRPRKSCRPRPDSASRCVMVHGPASPPARAASETQTGARASAVYRWDDHGLPAASRRCRARRGTHLWHIRRPECLIDRCPYGQAPQPPGIRVAGEETHGSGFYHGANMPGPRQQQARGSPEAERCSC